MTYSSSRPLLQANYEIILLKKYLAYWQPVCERAKIVFYILAVSHYGHVSHIGHFAYQLNGRQVSAFVPHTSGRYGMYHCVCHSKNYEIVFENSKIYQILIQIGLIVFKSIIFRFEYHQTYLKKTFQWQKATIAFPCT